MTAEETSSEPDAPAPEPRAPTAHLVVLALAVVALAAALSHQGIARVERFGYGSPDDALLVQGIYNTTQGRFAQTSLERWNPPWEVNLLGAHADVSWVVYVPIAVFAPGWRAPMLIQPLLVLLGAFPLFFLALRRLGRPGVALAVACLYLAHPLLESNCLRIATYFPLTPPLLLFAIERLDRGRLRSATVLFVLALLTREEVALSVCAFLLPLAVVEPERRRWSLAVAIGCILWFVLYTMVLRVHAFGPGPNMVAGRYDYLGGSMPAILLSPVLHPVVFFGHLLRSHGLLVGFLVLLPVGPALLCAPRYLLAALVPIVGVALSAKASDHVLGKYLIPAIPFMYAGLVVGLERIRRWTEARRTGDLSLLALACAGLLTLCALGTDVGIFARYRPLRCLNQLHLRELEAITPEHRELRELLAKVPRDASVSASPLTWLHLAARRSLYAFPIRARDVDFVVVDTTARLPRWPLTSPAAHAELVKKALREPGVRVEWAGGYALIDRRGRR